MSRRYHCDRQRQEFSPADSRNSRLRASPLVFFLWLLCISPLQGQSIPRELGIQLTGTHLHKLDETPLGVGARLFLDFTRRTSFDAEVTYFTNPRASSVLSGIKSGFRSSRFGTFGKTRAGIWHFGGSYFDPRLNRKTFFTMDLGGILEYYPSRRTVVRIDLGDTVIFYQSARLGTVHNFQPGLGFSFRF
jgi:hypothetical protein